MKKSEAIAELSKAFVKTQKELKQPLKDANNPFFKSKYVPLENVVESITKSASKNGLAFSQFPGQDETGAVTVGTLVMHESGEWIEYDPIKIKPVKNDPQAIGSAITYAKRYALSAIFGITSDQDDDGNEATQPAKGKQQSQPAKKQTPKTKKDAKSDEANALFVKLENRGVIKQTIMGYIESFIKETGKPDTLETKIEAMKELDTRLAEKEKEKANND